MMASSRDDMVFTPRLGPEHKATAQTRAREERRLAGASKRKGGVLTGVARLVAARRLNRARRALKARRRARMRKAGPLRGAMGVAGRGATRAAVFNPIGLLVTALVVGVAAATRLATGQPFEVLGQKLNNMLLGDMDEQARAEMETRNLLSSHRELTRISGQEGGVNAQMQAIFKGLSELRKKELDGMANINSEAQFGSNSVFEMMLIRAFGWLKGSFVDSGGTTATNRLQRNIAPLLRAR